MIGSSVKFYIPYGKYCQQVFALETTQKGSVAVYMPDVTSEALVRNLLSPSPIASSYRVPGKNECKVLLEPITADTCETVVCKAMMGWGKRALVTTLDRNSTAEQIAAGEQLCSLAAEFWPVQPEPQAWNIRGVIICDVFLAVMASIKRFYGKNSWRKTSRKAFFCNLASNFTGGESKGVTLNVASAMEAPAPRLAWPEAGGNWPDCIPGAHTGTHG